MNAVLRLVGVRCNSVLLFAILLSVTVAHAKPPASDWLPGDEPYQVRAGIGTFDELLTAIDAIAEEGRAWRDGLEKHTPYLDQRLEALAGQLWILSGSGEPLATVKPFDVTGHWDEVVEKYRALAISGRDRLPFQEFLWKNIEGSIEGLNGARSNQASSVLYYWIRFLSERSSESNRWELENEGLKRSQGDVPSQHPPTLRQVADRDQWRQWFQDQRPKMRWDADRKQFTNERGEGLSYPYPKQFAEFLAAAERKTGVAVGSTDRKPGAGEQAPPEQKKPRERPAKGKPEFPVLYSSRDNPDPLDVEQVAAVEKIAEQTMPKGRRIWFVYVCSKKRENAEADDAGQGLVVYYTPDRTTKRLRTGRYARVGWFGQTPYLSTYADVSDEQRPFGKDPSMPAEANLPFQRPGKNLLSDAQVVLAIDQVREKTDEPILYFNNWNGKLACKTGWIGGPLNGGGSSFTIEKEEDGSVTVGGRGIWMS